MGGPRRLAGGVRRAVWGEIRWFLSWLLSPVPMSWLLLGICIAQTVLGLEALLARADSRAAAREYRVLRDSLASASGGLLITLPNGAKAWIAPARADTTGHDTVKARRVP